MTLFIEVLPESERRLSMDSTLGFAKRAAKHDSGLCLICGRRATGRCSKCALATFCGPQCQEAARSTHSGACESACSVLSRRIVQRWLPRDELSVLQHMIVLVGQNCNPVSSAKDQGLQGCMKVLEYIESHPKLLQRNVADFLLMGCQALMKHRICCNPHIFAFCFIDSCLKRGSVNAFAESAGLSANAEQSSQVAKRYMEWQKTCLLPMQEMFGQIGIGRYWESEPAPIEAGMLGQHTSPLRQLSRRGSISQDNSPVRMGGSRGASFDSGSWHSMQGRSCKDKTASWVSRHGASSNQLSMDRACSIPAHV